MPIVLRHPKLDREYIAQSEAQAAALMAVGWKRHKSTTKAASAKTEEK